MPFYLYTSDEVRDFNDFGRMHPGDHVEADANPDPERFTDAGSVVMFANPVTLDSDGGSFTVESPEPEAVEAPVVDSPVDTPAPTVQVDQTPVASEPDTANPAGSGQE
jgi:hypothetical protein